MTFQEPLRLVGEARRAQPPGLPPVWAGSGEGEEEEEEEEEEALMMAGTLSLANMRCVCVCVYACVCVLSYRYRKNLQNMVYDSLPCLVMATTKGFTLSPFSHWLGSFTSTCTCSA